MVVSLFCTGFASWAIIAPYEPPTAPSGNTVAYGVVQHDPAYFGLSLANQTSDEKAAKTFRYSTTTNAGSTTETNAFTSTTLSIFIAVDRAKMAKHMETGEYSTDRILINCYTAKNGSIWPISKNADTGYQTSYSWEANKLVYDKTCKLTLVGYSNLYVTASVAAHLSSDSLNGSLDISIPIEQIYNLASLDKLKAETSYLELELTFSDTGYTNANIPVPCGYTPTFTIQTVGI